jgi:hypothetical protein
MEIAIDADVFVADVHTRPAGGREVEVLKGPRHGPGISADSKIGVLQSPWNPSR